MKKISVLLLAAVCVFCFVACDSCGGSAGRTTGGTETATTAAPEGGAESYRVTEDEWNDLFDLEKLAFRSNLMIRVVYPGAMGPDPASGEDWEATVSFDDGKIYVTGLGLRTQPEGEPPAEQRTDGYVHMKALAGDVLTYDDYSYWNGWTVEERESTLVEFFMSYGLFEHRYADFAFDEETNTYVSVPQTGESENVSLAARYGLWAVRIVDGRIEEVRLAVGEEESIYFYYSSYGEISVTFPQIES